MYSTKYLKPKLRQGWSESKLTLNNLSSQSKINLETIKSFLYKKKDNPTLDTLIRLSKALKRPVDWFLSE